MLRIVAGLCLFVTPGLAQSFDTASVKVSRTILGHEGTVTTGPTRFTARNATLKRLIYEAWQTPYDRINGGPKWLNSDEYDIEATAGAPVRVGELRLMLRTLLAERFRLQLHTEERETRVYALIAAKGGPKLVETKLGGPAPWEGPGVWTFHGDLSQFADVLALKLTIPVQPDPTRPAIARGTPIPVVNKTGIQGVYDFAFKMNPDPETDPFTFWQRTLQEQLGLHLESAKLPVDFLVIDRAERVPAEN